MMPVVTIRITRGPTLEDKRALAAAVTDAVASTLALPAERVRILIEEYELENVATGGELHADRARRDGDGPFEV
ncbi:tautomerase family protein [Xanthobacter variabilis]|uniref:tautomerase family protein n=2 Tax=Xanthobacter TaxID=279 RepID=UPI00372BEBAF